jgi:23S rRNA (adenine2503-C2)-methyltransferase
MLRTWSSLKSNVDDSVNFYKDYSEGKLETRYVRRSKEKMVVYLSSQSGCNLACRFCRLTQTGQTDFKQVGFFDYLDQANTVLNYYKDNIQETNSATRVNFDFMARGEALLNQTVMYDFSGLAYHLVYRSRRLNLTPKFNVSTIMPNTITDEAFANFCDQSNIYLRIVQMSVFVNAGCHMHTH